jgi:hypothetical protein
MSANTNYGYEDTLTGTINVSLPALDYETDYAVVSEQSNNVVLTNVTTGVDQPETLRFAIQDVANVYSGTSIDPANFAPSRRGKKLLVSDHLTLRVPNGDGTSTDFPVKMGLTFEFPTSVNLSDSAISDALHRVFAAAYDVSADTPASGVYAETLYRIKRLIRSSLNPIK